MGFVKLQVLSESFYTRFLFYNNFFSPNFKYFFKNSGRRAQSGLFYRPFRIMRLYILPVLTIFL